MIYTLCVVICVMYPFCYDIRTYVPPCIGMHTYMYPVMYVSIRICTYIKLYNKYVDGVLSLEHSNYTVDDRIDVLSVTILLSSVASKDVIVVVTITDGTATGIINNVYVHTSNSYICISHPAGIDYNVTASVFNVTISAGAASSSFNIDIIDDVIHESHESFDIAIRMLPNCLSLSLGISFSTVTIIDDDSMYLHV